MKKNDTLVIGVFYPGIEKYINKYIQSIQNQTYSNFDWLIIFDNFNTEKIFNSINKEIIIKKVYEKLTPSQIRQIGIKYSVDNGYKNLIFTDSDDYYSKNRFEKIVKGLIKSDFVYNELDIVNDKNILLKNDYLSSLYIKEKCENYQYLLDNNFFGLTNSSVRVEKIKGINIPDDIIAVDWWIFTLLLLNGCNGKFIKVAKSYYRQSSDNLVGVGKQLDEKRLQMGINVKIIHYKDVKIYCDKNKLIRERGIYNNKLDEMLELKNKIENPIFRKSYIDVINNNFDKIFKGWWSEILPINKWRKYAK